jgi:hypothetical protein
VSPLGTAQIGTPRAAVSQKPTPGGQSSTVAPSRGGNGIVIGSLGVVVLMLGAGAFFLLGGKHAAPAAVALAPEPHVAPTALVSAPAPTIPVVETTVTPAATPSPEVHVHVVTEPEGATLTKAGFQVCATTPCDLVANRNEGLDLEARKGALRGQTKIMPQTDQDVTITLVAPVTKPKTERLCEVDVDGLKIARPCKK